MTIHVGRRGRGMVMVNVEDGDVVDVQPVAVEVISRLNLTSRSRRKMFFSVEREEKLFSRRKKNEKEPFFSSRRSSLSLIKKPNDSPVFHR